MVKNIKRISVIFLFFLIGIGLLTVLFGSIKSNEIFKRIVGYEYLGVEGVVLQEEKNDCGPAALMNIFQYHGIVSTLDDIKEIAGTTDNGTSMLGLKRAAENKGLNAQGWDYTWEDFRQIVLPTIAFVNGDHYVVVLKFTPYGDLIIIDPAKGLLEMNHNKFNKIWHGETLVFRDPAKMTERVPEKNPLVDSMVIGGSCGDERR